MAVADEKESDKAESVAPERRRNVRFPFTATVEVTEPKAGARIVGRTSDLGSGGCYVDAISPFPVGTNALVKIRRETESFEAQAKVVYSQTGMGMGLAFVSADPKQFKIFQRWLQEISGEAPSAPEMYIQPEIQEPPKEVEQKPAETVFREESSYVLSELLITLIRKNILTEAEGKALLKKLHG